MLHLYKKDTTDLPLKLTKNLYPLHIEQREGEKRDGQRGEDNEGGDGYEEDRGGGKEEKLVGGGGGGGRVG